MLSTHIDLSVPTINGLTLGELDQTLDDLGAESLSIVELGFHGDFGGSASLLFPPDSAAKLAALLTGSSVSNVLNAMHIETLNEIGNIILNALMGSFSNIMGSELLYNLPNYSEVKPQILSDKIAKSDNVVILLVKTTFSASEVDIVGHILILFEVSSFLALTQALSKLMPEE